MCLGVPALVEKIDGDQAEVRLGEVRTRASLSLLDHVRVGEYIILHAGFAIAKVSPEEAAETLKLIREISGYEENPDG